MSYENTNVMRRWFEEVWNQGREEAIDELAADGMVGHGLYDSEGQEIVGKEKFKVFWRQFRSAFPDVRVDFEDELMVGDKAMVRCTVRATHKGEGIGVSPCHKPICFSGMVIGRFEDGKLQEAWDTWDFLGLYHQIGEFPPAFAKK